MGAGVICARGAVRWGLVCGGFRLINDVPGSVACLCVTQWRPAGLPRSREDRTCRIATTKHQSTVHPLLAGSLCARLPYSARMISAAFSPTTMDAALVFPLGISGMIEASAMRRPLRPRTLSEGSTTLGFSCVSK